MIIYKTTNTVNNKIYIGQDFNNNPNYLGSGLALNNAMQKYGKEHFIKEIIEHCTTKDELNEREKYWIAHYNSTDKTIGYNISTGGQGGKMFADEYYAPGSPWYEKMKNIVQDPEYRKNQGEISTKRFQDPSVRKKHADILREVYQDSELRQKCAEGNRKRLEDLTVRARYSTRMKEFNKTRFQDAEVRNAHSKRMTEFNKQRYADASYKEKHSELIKKAYEKNPLYKKKVSDALKKKYQNPEYREKHREHVVKRHAKTYVGFVSPDGVIYKDVYNLCEFSRTHGLSQGAMSCVNRGIYTHHKGWKKYIPPIE